MIKMYLKNTITTISFTLLAAMAAFAQTSAPATLKDNDNKTAIEVYNIMKEQGGGSVGKGKSGKGKSNNAAPKVNISGYAVKVGPDVYGLPSVELSDTKGGKTRILCVLPFSDYLKLRHVSKGDKVTMKGEVRGYADEYDFVLVKQSKIVSVNGKKP
ncbi:MAG: OB-fold putative lipoprotein [Duncaniella sp.]|nr:OB-fold putative lipoprotein [Duncaniella sp.]